MKAEVILLSDIDKYLKLVRLERELVTKLTLYKEMQELQLKRLESIKETSKGLQAHYQLLGKKPREEEIREAIKKYAR